MKQNNFKPFVNNKVVTLEASSILKLTIESRTEEVSYIVEPKRDLM